MLAQKTITIPDNLASGYIRVTMDAGHNLALRLIRFDFTRTGNELTVTCTIGRVGAQCYESGNYYVCVGSAATNGYFSAGGVSGPSTVITSGIQAGTQYRISTPSFYVNGNEYYPFRANAAMGSVTVTVPDSGAIELPLTFYTNSGGTAEQTYQLWENLVVESIRDIPLYFNMGGTIRRSRTVYANIGGTIKTCTVYTNVGGEIKKIG